MLSNDCSGVPQMMPPRSYSKRAPEGISYFQQLLHPSKRSRGGSEHQPGHATSLKVENSFVLRPCAQPHAAVSLGSLLAEEDADADIQHWRRLEVRLQPSLARAWKLQEEVTPRMRTVLVDWIFELCDEFKLTPETFFLAVSYIDRYLSGTAVLRGELQLVGITCLWIAAKYEDVRPPTSKQLTDMTGQTYRVDQMCSMEGKVLAALGFEMGAPTPYKFLTYYNRMAQAKLPVDLLLTRHLIEMATLASSPDTCSPAGSPCSFPTAAAAAAAAPCSAFASSFPRCILGDEGTPPAAASTLSECPSLPLSPPVLSNASTPCSSQQTGALEPDPEPLFNLGWCVTGAAAAAAVSQPCSEPRQQLRQQRCCLASALPSHIAAAALLASLRQDQECSVSAGLQELLSMAQCDLARLRLLSEAMRELGATLSSHSTPCGMVRQHQLQRQALQRRILMRLAVLREARSNSQAQVQVQAGMCRGLQGQGEGDVVYSSSNVKSHLMMCGVTSSVGV